MEIAAPYQPGSTRRVTVTVDGEAGRRSGRSRHHRGRAGLDHVDGQPLPLRPGVVEYPGPVHRGAAQPAGRGRPAAGRQDRVRAGRRAPGQGQEGHRLQVRAGRDRLPQAVFRRLPAGPGGPAAADGRRPGRDRRRQLQRAEHQLDLRRSHHPQRRLRHRVPAGRVRRRPAQRVDARRVRPRSGLSGPDGRGRPDLVGVGARAVPPVGPVRGRRAAATGGCSSAPSSSGSRRTAAGCSPPTWPTTTARAGGCTRRRTCRRQNSRRTASSAGWPRSRPRATSCCRSAPTTSSRLDG